MNDEEFNRNLQYALVAEKRIAEFFKNKGYKVLFADEYGVFPDDAKYIGPQISLLYPNTFYSSEEVEVSSYYITAPDLYATRKNEKIYLEIKRREYLNTFDGRYVVYIKEKSWEHCNELEYFCEYFGYGNGVNLFVCVDEFEGMENVTFVSSISRLRDNIKARKKGLWVAFDLHKNFKMIE